MASHPDATLLGRGEKSSNTRAVEQVSPKKNKNIYSPNEGVIAYVEVLRQLKDFSARFVGHDDEDANISSLYFCTQLSIFLKWLNRGVYLKSCFFFFFTVQLVRFSIELSVFNCSWREFPTTHPQNILSKIPFIYNIVYIWALFILTLVSSIFGSL